MLTAAAETHPLALRGTRAVANPGYVDPARYVPQCDAVPLPAAPLDTTTRLFDDRLSEARRATAAWASAAGVASHRVSDLVLAVNEAASNAVEHGAGSGVLRCWSGPDGFVCEVTDVGGRLTDPFAGHLPPDLERSRGLGLWLMRQVTDLVQVRCGEAGTTVRIHLFD